jgi:hypothetical protein
MKFILLYMNIYSFCLLLPILFLRNQIIKNRTIIMITATDNDSRNDINIITVLEYVTDIFKYTVWIEYKLTGEHLINQYE